MPSPDRKYANATCFERTACDKLPAMFGLPDGITTCLFDLDGVRELTELLDHA